MKRGHWWAPTSTGGVSACLKTGCDWVMLPRGLPQDPRVRYTSRTSAKTPILKPHPCKGARPEPAEPVGGIKGDGVWHVLGCEGLRSLVGCQPGCEEARMARGSESDDGSLSTDGLLAACNSPNPDVAMAARVRLTVGRGDGHAAQLAEKDAQIKELADALLESGAMEGGDWHTDRCWSETNGGGECLDICAQRRRALRLAGRLP